MTRAAEWKLDAGRAWLSVGTLTAIVDLSAPRRGLHQISLDARPLTGAELLGVELSASGATLTDSYQRGGDLVATYADTPSAAMTTQIYWRAAAWEFRGVLCPTVDVQVSVQTSLLDARPAVRTRSRLPTRVAERCGTSPRAQSRANELFPHSIVFRTADGKASYVELVHPSAAAASETGESSATATEIVHRLFECELEKGVILRAQVRGLFVPRDGEIDVPLVAEAYQQFVDRPPPLTA